MVKLKIEELTIKVPHNTEVKTNVYACCNNFMIKVQDIDEYKSEFIVPSWNNARHLEIRQGMNKVLLNEELLKPGVKCAIVLHSYHLYYGEIIWIDDHINCCVKATNNKSFPFSVEELIKGAVQVFIDK